MLPNPQETEDLTYLLKKSLMENFIFCAVYPLQNYFIRSIQESIVVLKTSRDSPEISFFSYCDLTSIYQASLPVP